MHVNWKCSEALVAAEALVVAGALAVVEAFIVVAVLVALAVLVVSVVLVVRTVLDVIVVPAVGVNRSFQNLVTRINWCPCMSIAGALLLAIHKGQIKLHRMVVHSSNQFGIRRG
jgi:small-conductance mechanosensitive channel